MLNQKVLAYVDDVMSMIDEPDEFKVKFENELIRHIIEASEYKSVDEVLNKLGTPETFADEMSCKSINELKIHLSSYFTESINENLCPAKMTDRSCRKHVHVRRHDRNLSPRNYGEYIREESNVNIKLLYIPLIQISSGVERIRVPLTEEYHFD